MEIKERVGHEDNEIFEEHIARYNFACQFTRDKIVYSIACGRGYGEKIIATKGMAEKVVGIENNNKAIEFAKNYNKKQNIHYICSDIFSLNLKNNVADVVISFETIEHINDDNLFLKILKNLLKPDGILLISTPNKAASYRSLISRRSLNPYHVREYQKAQFEKLLRKYFKEIEFYGQKKIFKRSWLNIPAYLINKFSGKLEKIDNNNHKVVKYPTEPNREMCQFVAVCKK